MGWRMGDLVKILESKMQCRGDPVSTGEQGCVRICRRGEGFCRRYRRPGDFVVTFCRLLGLALGNNSDSCVLNIEHVQGFALQQSRQELMKT